MDNMDRNSLSVTINELVTNFARHSDLVEENGSKIRSNLFDLLQDFWTMKLTQKGPPTISTQVVYEFVERPGAPYICFVTLPGGACFATFQNLNDKFEAKKSAALIALMNSVLNEHPSRRIDDCFIKKHIEQATKDNPGSCSLSLHLYKRMLEMCKNKTMLEFKQMMGIFELLNWNGSLSAMRKNGSSLEQVVNFYKNFRIDENVRMEMALDWVTKEAKQPGTIAREIDKCNTEIEQSRLAGRELGFLKEKRHILILALFKKDNS